MDRRQTLSVYRKVASLTYMCVRVLLLQFDVIKRYVDGGGSLLVLMSEGGESRAQTNINYLLEQYGISVNSGQLLNCIDTCLFLGRLL